MAVDYTTNYPLMIVGTDVLDNMSFEDWASGDPVGWTDAIADVTTQEDDPAYCHPHGFSSCRFTANASAYIYQSVAYSTFGYTNLPSWADSFVFAVLVYRASGSGGSIRIGTSPSTNIPATTGEWMLVYVETTSSTLSSTLRIYAPSSGIFYVDSCMAGFTVDFDCPMKEWNPIDKEKKEKRETPFDIATALQSDAMDLKCELTTFDTALKTQINGALKYLKNGHYYGMILDRSASGPYRDEIMPYLAHLSQDSPRYLSGAPTTYRMKFNGRGCLPV